MLTQKKTLFVKITIEVPIRAFVNVATIMNYTAPRIFKLNSGEKYTFNSETSHHWLVDYMEDFVFRNHFVADHSAESQISRLIRRCEFS